MIQLAKINIIESGDSAIITISASANVGKSAIAQYITNYLSHIGLNVINQDDQEGGIFDTKRIELCLSSIADKVKFVITGDSNLIEPITDLFKTSNLSYTAESNQVDSVIKNVIIKTRQLYRSSL